MALHIRSQLPRIVVALSLLYLGTWSLALTGTVVALPVSFLPDGMITLLVPTGLAVGALAVSTAGHPGLLDRLIGGMALLALCIAAWHLYGFYVGGERLFIGAVVTLLVTAPLAFVILLRETMDVARTRRSRRPQVH